MNYYLGIDCGSTMVKAALFDRSGKEVAVRSVKNKLLHPKSGWTEIDMNALWENIVTAIGDVLRFSGVDPKSIACVACCGHGNGLFLADADGNPTRNGIGSSDGRARKYIEDWNRENILEHLRPKTMQAIWPAQPNALLRWLLDNEPETVAKARWLFMCKDFIRFRLTGEAFMELSDMSGTSLIDVGTGDYDDALLDAWGLSVTRRLMPPLRNSGDLCGKITKDVAARTGLVAGTPVAGGMFDIDACGLAVGMVDETQLCLVAGTWGNNQYISKTPVVSPDIFMTSRYSIPGYYLMLEGSASSASNFEWIVTEFFQADGKLLEMKNDKLPNIYSYCVDLASRVGPKESGVIFLPYLYGSPVSLDGKGVLFGLDGRQTRGHVLRAVLEGIIFGHVWHVEKLLKFRPKPDTIRLTGGGTASKFWTQMFADIFQTRVEVPAGSELGCLGAAICAAVAIGDAPSYEIACRDMVKIEQVHEPNRELADIYRKKYERFRKLLDVLAPAWEPLAW